MFGKKKQTGRGRHQRPVTGLKTVREHQKREQKRIRALERGLKDRHLGLYIHIPFCQSKCAYCDFYSLAGREKQMDAYAAALTENLTELAEQVAPFTVDTVYVGGGTPSYFGEKRLRALLHLVEKSFRLDRNCEITVECNPESVTPALARALRKSCANRVSLGMQSAQDDELRAVGRPHDAAQVDTAVALLRRAGIRNLNLDLIYGLPKQSAADWCASVEAAIALEPEHLSLYALTLEEGTPLWQQREALDLPDDDALADRYLWAVRRLAAAGYEQYEISNFAQSGFASRHNQKYWLGEEYIGVGPAAHSDFGGCRYSYLPDLDAYLTAMQTGQEIVAESEQIPPRERAREYLMLRLRTTQGVEAREYRERFRMSFDPIAARLEEYAAHGWAVRQGERWHLTPEGFLLSNQLIGGVLEAQEAEMINGSAARLREEWRAHAPEGEKPSSGPDA